MKKLYSIVILLLVGVLPSLAQQDPMYSQYMFNMLSVNPAYAGSRDVVSMSTIYRKQWLQIDNSPRTFNFTVDAPFNKEKVGLGLNIFNDKLGLTNQTGLYASYAYRLRLPKSLLAMGLNVGFTQFKTALTSAVLSQQETFDAAFANNLTKTMPNVGFGLYYNTPKWYAGMSLPHLVNNKMLKGDTVALLSKQTRHLFLIAGYVLTLNTDIKMKPSILVKTVEGAPIQWDLNANFWFFDLVSLGASFRSSKALVYMVEVQANKQFRVGYAYDKTFGQTGRLAGGGHEILLRYEFGYVKAKILSPRYF